MSHWNDSLNRPDPAAPAEQGSGADPWRTPPTVPPGVGPDTDVSPPQPQPAPVASDSAPAPAPAPGDEEKAEKSLLKRGISFRRKDKPATQPRARQAKPPRTKRRRGLSAGKRIVGLKVGASQIAAATVVNNESPSLVQVAREQLEPGVVVGGELRDPQALAAALKRFFKQHKLPTRNVRLGIASNRIGVRTFELPPITDPKQLTNAVRFRAQETLPVPIDQALLDYQVLDERANGDGRQRVLLAVTYRDLVERYAAACREAGIQLVGVDLEAFALLRSLAAPRAPEQAPASALVAIAIGHERSTLAVSDGRVCEFTRVLPWGGASLNEEIARALEIAPSAADRIKRLVSLRDGDVPEGLSQDAVGRAREALRRQAHAFARELVSSLQFYQNLPGSLGISEIVLTGGTAHLGGIAEELEGLINVQVRVGDPLARVRVGKKVKGDEQIGSLAVAIGLGIED